MSTEGAIDYDFECYLRGLDPEAVELATAPTLDIWDVCVTTEDDGERCMTLTGVVMGHPTLGDCERIETSALVWLDRKHRWARVTERVYRLEGAAK
jgi:hypothetical protein